MRKSELLNLSDPTLIKCKALVNGEWRDAHRGETYSVVNPADQVHIGDVAYCGAEETSLAIDAAYQAFDEWRKTLAKARSGIIEAWAELIVSNKKDLAAILTAEQGKPLAEAEGEILYGASYIKWFAEEAKRVYGDTIANASMSTRLMCIKQPVGVVACITPWNFPNAMLARKLAPALAAGCTVVCKPANETPFSALALVELAMRAGVPKGVINIVSGDTPVIGQELTSNSKVKKLSFTGSTVVGKKLMADCAATMKRTSMELGGNAPFIVFDDADIEEAVDGLMVSKFRNAGQTCVCTNRVLVQNKVYDIFYQKLTEAIESLKLGTGADPETDIGPLINSDAAEKVYQLISDAAAKGAQVTLGGNKSELGGSFVVPTLITDVEPTMRVFQEETFGPVVSISKFESEADAIAMANDTPFGLAAYFYARDVGRIFRVAEDLEYGMLGINTGFISNEMSPFGGIKESGHGREGSKYGLDDYLQIKSLCVGGIDQ